MTTGNSGLALKTKATIMATRPIIEPTDRSMPLVIMTMVWASTTIDRIEMLSRMSRKLLRVRKAGARRVTSATKTRMKKIIPASRKRAKVASRFARRAGGCCALTKHLLPGWTA